VEYNKIKGGITTSALGTELENAGAYDTNVDRLGRPD
jgi:hypothetical protein